MWAVLALFHPYHRPSQLEREIWYAISVAAALGPSVKILHEQGAARLEDISGGTQRADQWAMQQRPFFDAPSQQTRPVFSTLMIAMMEWPDPTLPRCLVQGCQVAAAVRASGAL